MDPARARTEAGGAALNLFVHDCHRERQFLRATGPDPAVVLHNPTLRPEMQDFDPPKKAHAHVPGIEIVRTGPEEFHVLQDKCRTPSGVSYMLENREAVMGLLPNLCVHHRIALSRRAF